MTPNDFTVDTFCAASSISRPTAYRMIKAGELHAYKIRNSTRIPHTELARIQRENQIKPASTNNLLAC
jgi:excisionase family DNA binding protein